MLLDITPFQALSLVGELATRRGECLTTTCPCCGHDLNLVDEAFVCESSGCNFSRGGPLDYVAYVVGSYEKALALATEFSPHFKTDALPEPYRASRAITEFFIRMENLPSASDVGRLMLKQAFTSATGINADAFPRGHLFLTESEANELVYLLASADITPPSNLQGGPVIVAPYWAFPHVLGHLIVTNASLRSVKSCDVYPHRYAWFGLTQKNVQCPRVAIFPSYLEALAQEELFMLHQPYSFPTHLLVTVRNTVEGLKLPEMVFHGSAATWANTLPAWSFMEGFATALFHDAEAGTMDFPSLLELLLTRSRQGDFYAFLDLCAALNMDQAARARVLMLTDRMHDVFKAKQLRETLTRRLLDATERYSLYETACGYEIETAGKKRSVTNFTLILDSVVGFSVLAGLQYQGRLIIGASVIPFDLPGKEFDSPKALERALQALQMQQAGACACKDQLATVTGSADFSKFMSWLKMGAATLPRSRGIRSLGWSIRHDSYNTPSTIVDAGGVHEGVRYYADPGGGHHCYRSEVTSLPLGDEMPVLSPEFAEVISAMVAQVIRLFHSRQARPVAVLNEEGSRAQGLRLFRGLGQTAPLRLPNVTPQQLEPNRGMPCLLANLNELQAAKMNFAGLWLADVGFDLGSVPPEQVETMSAALPGLLNELARRLLTGELKSYREKQSVRVFAAQAAEGAAVIRAEFWPEWPQGGNAWASVDKMLKERKPQLVSLATVDETAGKLKLPAALWEDLGFNRSDLLTELNQLCETLEPADDQAILIDKSSAYRLLHDFYGKVPALVIVA